MSIHSPQSPIQQGHFIGTISNWGLVPGGVPDGQLMICACIGHHLSRFPHWLQLLDSPHCLHGAVGILWCKGNHHHGETW